MPTETLGSDWTTKAQYWASLGRGFLIEEKFREGKRGTVPKGGS